MHMVVELIPITGDMMQFTEYLYIRQAMDPKVKICVQDAINRQEASSLTITWNEEHLK